MDKTYNTIKGNNREERNEQLRFSLFAGQPAALGAAVGYTVTDYETGAHPHRPDLGTPHRPGKLDIITIHWESVEALYETASKAPSSWLEGIMAWFPPHRGGRRIHWRILLGFRYGIHTTVDGPADKIRLSRKANHPVYNPGPWLKGSLTPKPRLFAPLAPASIGHSRIQGQLRPQPAFVSDQ